MGEDGLFVAVPNPVTSEAVTRIKAVVDQGRQNPARPVRKVIFDFTNGKDARTASYGPCFELADYVRGLHDLQTIAYADRNAAGHTVAPVLACQQIAMSREGSLGEIAGPAEADTITNIVKLYYDDLLAATGREGYRAVVRKMYDRGVSLGKARKGEGNKAFDYYVDLRDRAKLDKDVRLAGTDPLPFAGPNAEGRFPAERLRDMGLVNTLQETRKDLADAYGLSAASLREDPLAGRPPVAFRYTLRGPVDGGVKEATDRTLADVARKGGNVVFLEIECAGGDFQAARDLADVLAKYQHGENPMLVVGFIPKAAPDTAAVIALGCSEIVMSRGKGDKGGDGEEATIGGFEQLLGRDANRADLWRQSLRDVAERQGYPPVLVDCFFDRDLVVYRAHAKNQPARKRLMTEAEFEADKANWVNDGAVKTKGQLLKLTATDAQRLGLARHVVDGRDLSEVATLYGVEPTKVREATPGWLDRFADYLRKPTVTVLLVVIGFAGLILELKVPGTTVPGIIAALCFILVFWAHSQFNGQAAVLGGLLFALGLVLILLEVFVIPGFGVTGVLGLVFMLGGVGLATLGRLPETGEEWGAFGVNVGQYVGALAGAMALAFALARFLPKIPYANRLMLVPPGEAADPSEPQVDLPGAAVAASLLGAVGLSATPLRPAGMAAFGEQYVDVVTEGGFIPAGVRVQVIEVEGTRIVVKEV
jgi:membrane-bound ClpP family serine protease